MQATRIAVLAFLGSFTLLAQEQRPVPPVDVVPPPPGVPIADEAQPAVVPAEAPHGGDMKDQKIVEPIDEPKLSGDALADLYRKYTGRRVIVTSPAAAAEFRFVQGASPEDPLTYGEAAELLRIAAVLENFVFVQHPQEKNLDILTLASGGPRPPNISIDVKNENTPLPDTDVVISYVMTFKYIKPDQALNIFTQVIGQFGAYGSIAAVPNASAIVITEKASLIKSLVELKETIDVPGDVQATRFIKVEYADVTEIATTLTELLSAQQGAEGTASVQRAAPAGGAPPQHGGTPVAGAGGATGGGETTPVQIIPEPRTNRIFAMGRPVDLLFVEGLVREFDVPSSEKTFLRRKLRFLTVSAFLPVASNALTRAFSGATDGASAGGGTTGAGGGAAPTGGRTSSIGNRSQIGGRSNTTGGAGGANFGGSNSGSFGGSSSFGGGGSSFGGSGGIGGGGGLNAPETSSAPESVLVGRTLLVADNITNSVVVQGPPSALEIIERLLDQIDVKPDQVMISTVIGQLTHNNDREFGVNYLFKGEDFKGGGGAGPILPILPVGDNATSRFPTPDPQALIGSGLRAYGVAGDLTYFVRAVQERANFTVLSRPSIFTSNNQIGSISSGERIAIPTNTNSFSGGGSNTNIEYQDVVLKLEVIPLVNSDNEITMQVALLNDEQNGTQTIQGAGNNGDDLTVPRISTRTILTTVTVPNNGTVVLGGLIIGRSGTNKTGIPILNDIPLLGNLFGNTKQEKNRSELLVFMQPSIVRNAATLTGVQDDFSSRYSISPDANNFADGDGALPGDEPTTKWWEGAAKPSEPGVAKPEVRKHKR
jgi:general secretion pathway protein D